MSSMSSPAQRDDIAESDSGITHSAIPTHIAIGQWAYIGNISILTGCLSWVVQGCDTLYNLVQPPQVSKLTSPQAMSNSSQASYRAMTSKQNKFRKSYKLKY
ncbi:hypothetical protein EDB89DRAFT_1911164 [Lactarius sanguifluus]|nr:hypothetical protein EDB89DRAFT_1911164 [Lactarius sanguifluus]